MLALGLLATPGCVLLESSGSFSDSSGSISDSAGSFSDSSTSSSGDDTAYRGDIREYTVAYVRAEGTPNALRLGLSEVALARGISDWEALPATFVAVGAGLAEAGLPRDAVVAYQNALARPGTANHDSIRQGFVSATP